MQDSHHARKIWYLCVSTASNIITIITNKQIQKEIRSMGWRLTGRKQRMAPSPCAKIWDTHTITDTIRSTSTSSSSRLPPWAGLDAGRKNRPISSGRSSKLYTLTGYVLPGMFTRGQPPKYLFAQSKRWFIMNARLTLTKSLSHAYIPNDKRGIERPLSAILHLKWENYLVNTDASRVALIITTRRDGLWFRSSRITTSKKSVSTSRSCTSSIITWLTPARPSVLWKDPTHIWTEPS